MNGGPPAEGHSRWENLAIVAGSAVGGGLGEETGGEELAGGGVETPKLPDEGAAEFAAKSGIQTGASIRGTISKLEKGDNVPVVHSRDELQALFDSFKQGGAKEFEGASGGKNLVRYRLPDGTTVQWRSASTSGKAGTAGDETLDVRYPGVKRATLSIISRSSYEEWSLH
jgi:hypothetical protein